MTAGATVPHRDFGHVRLRLSEADGGLALALSSPDPGFAPVAAAALRTTPASAEPTGSSTPSSLLSASTSDQPQGALTQQRGGESFQPPAPAPARRDPPSGAVQVPGASRKPAAEPGGGVYA